MERAAARREASTALAIYGVLVAVAWLWGFRMEIPWHFYQVLPAKALAERLGESLFYLHAQPPLLNLGLGLALKVGPAMTLHPAVLLLGIHIAAGAAAVYGFALLCHRMIDGPWLRRIAIALFVLHPVLYLSLFFYFYTFHELVILALLPLAVLAYARHRGTGAYLAVCLGVVLLGLSHSLFHFAWGAAVLLGLPWLLRRARSPGSFAAPQVAAFAVSLALLLAWPLKNGLVFGSYSASSWTGYNMALELPVEIEALPERNWEVPEAFLDIPALAQREKAGGAPNWNHYSIIAHSRNQGRLAREAIVREPGSLGRKAWLNYWNYTRFSGRNPYTGLYGITTAKLPENVRPWLWAYEKLVFLDPRHASTLAHRAYRRPPLQSWTPGPFAFVLPVILVAAAWAIWRRRARDPSRAVAAGFMLFTAVWVLLITLFVDGSEANRIRFSTEPYLVLLAVFAIDSLRRKPGLDREDEPSD